MLLVSVILAESFNLHNMHQKSNRQTLFLFSKKNNWKHITGQKFRWCRCSRWKYGVS